MAHARGFRRCIAVGIVSFISQSALAQDAATDPQVARDNAETARLTAETALINAKAANIKATYGEPAKAPEGNISGQDKFGALAQWTHASAIEVLGTSTVEPISTILGTGGACHGKTIYITSVADARPGRVVATSIEKQLKDLSSALKGGNNAPTVQSVIDATAMIRGTIGALDSLVGLFRSDYAIADLSSAADELALRIKVAELVAGTDGWKLVQIDGLNRAPSEELRLMSLYRDFDTARKHAIDQNKSQKNSKKKAELAAIIASADSFDKVITTQPSTPNAQSPLVAAAIALETPPTGACVLFATYSVSSSTITRKRLLSRNDRIMAASGGLLKIALFAPDGTLLKAALAPLEHSGFVDLKSLKFAQVKP